MNDTVPTTSGGPAEPRNERMLREFLAEEDAPCPACGYNLRQLVGKTCPECGLLLKLAVGSDEPFKRTWAIALFVNSLIAGIGALFLSLWLFMEDFRVYTSGSFEVELVTDVVFLVGWFVPILWLAVPPLLMWKRAWFCGLGVVPQRVFLGASIAWLVLQVIATFNFFK